MQPTPYLFFNGTCRAAMEVYADVFGAAIEAMAPFSELPPSEDVAVPEGKAGWIMHAALRWPDGGLLMASDNLDEDQPRMEGAAISMALPTVEAARAAFDRLAEGGEVGMPFGPMFWTPGFGTLRDRFGTRWMITTEAPEPG
ncbi:MAG: VOC family protein [Deinococcus-Thermus bacterium]|jgi:PhnB protein|nr:VOC family protein [Deinococcota bacterium]